MSRVTLIAAVGSNGVIGADGRMPWHLPEDFAFFKSTTMGHAMVMGRKTFDSIGRVLPGRRTIVITRQADWSHTDVEVVHSLVDALSLTDGDDEVFVVGGGQVYAEAMPLADRLLVTEVDQEPAGDVRFPEVDGRLWEETGREQRDGFAFVEHLRRSP